MLGPYPSVFWVYVEDESNGCVKQLLKLINCNKNTLQNNSVDLSPNIKLVADYWLQWKLVTNLATLYDYIQTECCNLSS